MREKEIEKHLKKQNKKQIMKHITKDLGKTLNLDLCIIFEFNPKLKKNKIIALWENNSQTSLKQTKEQLSENCNEIFMPQIKNKKNFFESHKTKPNQLLTKKNLAKFIHEELNIKSLFLKTISIASSSIFVLCGITIQKEKKLKKIEIKLIETTSKLAEIEIMQSEFLETIRTNFKEISELASMIEQAQEIFVLTDINGTIEYTNPQFEKTTGYSKKEVLGKHTRILKSGKHTKEFYKNLWETIKSGKKWENNIVNKKKNNELYTERAIIYPIKNTEGEIVKFCKIARDITKETVLEEKLRHAQKMEALATLARGMAHDFNNIIATILMNTNLAMLYSKDNPELHSLIENIKIASETASDVVKKILSFAKKTNNERKLIDFNETIKNSIKLLKSATPKNITLKINIPESKYFIWGNEAEIHQVFMNICNNAIQAIENKKGEIEISVSKIFITDNFLEKYPGIHLIKNKEYIQLTIKDNGKGISQEIRNKIFEPYFTTKGHGTGLGLPIVHGIVESYNGEIFLESEKGKGTVFKIYFPI